MLTPCSAKPQFGQETFKVAGSDDKIMMRQRAARHVEDSGHA